MTAVKWLESEHSVAFGSVSWHQSTLAAYCSG